jgi:gluconate 5-dehydrogenase
MQASGDATLRVLDRFRLDGRVAIVTGGSRGLGREMALALADAGADIAITGRSATDLAATAADIRALGRTAWTIAADMGIPAECEAALAQAIALTGHVDIMVNNVGGRRESVALADQTLESWQRLIDLNLTGCFLGTRFAGAAMLARGQGGRIINVASMNAVVAGRGIGGRHYETAKAAVLQLTRAAAADWAPHGITVNAICPGLFMTEANRKWQRDKPELIEAIVANIPMGRTGQPDELGPLAVYLASPAAAYVTGAALFIDGGYTLW